MSALVLGRSRPSNAAVASILQRDLDDLLAFAGTSAKLG
jgi:hypothetical protein